MKERFACLTSLRAIAGEACVFNHLYSRGGLHTMSRRRPRFLGAVGMVYREVAHECG